MRLFLIDYENVNAAGLHGIGQVSRSDRIILFYSHSANTLSFEIMDEMLEAGIMPERICLEQPGKNALDFQLVTFLGYMIAKNKADEYYIISKDAGYQAAIAFCKEYLGVPVQLKSSIRAAIGKQAAAKKPLTAKAKGKTAQVSLRKKASPAPAQPAQAPVPAAALDEKEIVTLDMILALIDPPITTDTATEILRCLQSCRSKTEFHNALQQRFDNDTVKLFYHCLKPCYAACLTD